MRDTIYIETTIVGHIAGRVHRDPFIAARQQATRMWWRDEVSKYAVFISQLVLDECSDGDPEAAAERLEVVVIPTFSNHPAKSMRWLRP